MLSKEEKHSWLAIVAVFFAGLGGFLFGYLTSIISGALLFLSQEFSLTTAQQSNAVSIILIGALVGALFAGALADQFGRRTTIIITSVLFIIGTWEVSISHSFTSFLIGRFITGVAVGIVSLTAPLYLSEIAPNRTRGAFVSVNQLSITIGVLAAFIVNYLFSEGGHWRWMMVLGIIPAALKLIGMAFLPESPAWLIAQGKQEKALLAMSKFRKGDGWKASFTEFMGSFKTEKSRGWRELLNPSLRMALFVGIAVCAFQQITGINAVTYFCAKIFQMAGFTSASQAILMTILVGTINVIATLFSLWVLDRAGRRLLLLIGMCGMGVALSALGIAFIAAAKHMGPLAIGCLMAYVTFFSIGIGPITWVLVSELYPHNIRGKAMTIGIFVNWLSNYAVSLTFLPLSVSMGTGETFCLYALLSFAACWFVFRYLPETKGKTPQEIEKAFQKRP